MVNEQGAGDRNDRTNGERDSPRAEESSWALVPFESAPAKISDRPSAAAGFPGVTQVVKFGVREMGFRRSIALLRDVNQKNGFDCQSCAWPNPSGTRHLAEFCENGAKAIASDATRKQADAAFFARHCLQDLASHSDQWLNDQGRLVEPLVRRAGSDHYEPISWDGAFQVIAQHLNSLESPNRASFYTSGRTSNEAAFLYQLFVREFGTNNLPDCSNMCHESSGAAMMQAIGVGKSTVTLDDFERCDTIVVIGQNPGTNHPRMLSALQRAKRNGARIISVNPLPEVGLQRVRNPNPQEASGPIAYAKEMLGSGTALADLHLGVRVNGDVALLNGLMKAILESESPSARSWVDREFIDEYCSGFEEMRTHLGALSWSDIVAGSGIERTQIERAAHTIVEGQQLIVCWAMGLTQHRNGVDNVLALMNLLLLGGHIGRDGSGACCVRGHSNVQGDRTMGICEKMPPAFLDRLGQEFGFSPPRDAGLDTVDAIAAMRDGRVSVLVAMGGNLLSAGPDTAVTAQAMRRCALTVQISTKLNRGHLVTGETALILPCLGRAEIDVQASGEQFVTVEDSLSVVSSSRGSLPPAGPLVRSEPAIVAGMAGAVLGSTSVVPWSELVGDYGRIRDRIAAVVDGFEQFNERINREAIQLRNAAAERTFRTVDGSARFSVVELPALELLPGELLLTTIRSHDQFNTTIYGSEDRYRGISGGRRVILVNPVDIQRRSLAEGDRVDVSSRSEHGSRQMTDVQLVAYPIAVGCAAMYFPEANVLVSLGDVAAVSNTPVSKSIRVSLSRSSTT